jgi:hypothetical protein
MSKTFNMKWNTFRWLCISILVLVEFISCLTIKNVHWWAVAFGCLLMFVVAYTISLPTTKKYKKEGL